MSRKTRVVKVGGSLLTWDELPSRIESWVAAQPAATTVMIAGGGPWVELMRQADKCFSLDEVAAHWMCVQAMSVTASLLAEICACRVVRTLAKLETESCNSNSTNPVVFDVQDWLLRGATAQELPKSWAFTSDSIAAQLAGELEADELVLFKSCPATSSDLSTLAAVNYVDDYFPIAAANVKRIRFENLR